MLLGFTAAGCEPGAETALPAVAAGFGAVGFGRGGAICPIPAGSRIPSLLNPPVDEEVEAGRDVLGWVEVSWLPSGAGTTVRFAVESAGCRGSLNPLLAGGVIVAVFEADFESVLTTVVVQLAGFDLSPGDLPGPTIGHGAALEALLPVACVVPLPVTLVAVPNPAALAAVVPVVVPAGRVIREVTGVDSLASNDGARWVIGGACPGVNVSAGGAAPGV